MAGLEQKLFANNKFNPFLWLQFLDDILCIWTDGEEKLNEFFEYLNEFHPTIKFTMEKSFRKINFLDVTVSKNNNKLATDLYTKETDTQYLHAKSCQCIKRAIPYGQAVHIKHICSEENVLNKRLTQLETWLLKWGYLQENVRPEIEIVNNLTSREDLLKRAEKNVGESVTLVLTFHLALNFVHAILRKAHHHVLKSNRLSRVLPSPPQAAFCNAKFLKDHLVRSKLKPESDVTTANFNCSSKRCKICKILVPGNECKCFLTKKTYKMSFQFDCNSSNVIYLISFTVCGRQYTGTMITRFRERFNQYKSNMNLYSQDVRGMMQEKMMIPHFFDFEHNCSIDDMHV